MAESKHGNKNNDWLKRAVIVLTILGMGWGAYAAIDGTYAKAADVNRRFDRMELTILHGQRRELQKQTFECEARKKYLLAVELARCQELANDLVEVLEQIRLLNSASPGGAAEKTK